MLMRGMPTSPAADACLVSCRTCRRRNRIPAASPGTPRCGQCHQVLPWIADAGDDTFADVAERAPVPVLVDLWAPWCGRSRMVSPALEQVAEQRAGRLKLVKVNVVQAPALSRRFEVQAAPTLLVLRDGGMIARRSGAAPAPVLRAWVDDALSYPL